MCFCVCVASMHVVRNTHLPVYGASFDDPISPWTLTQCPVCELTISPGADSWVGAEGVGGRPIAACSGRQLLLSPRPAPLTVELCAASASPESQHTCSYLVSYHRLCASPFALSVRSLSFSQRTGLFICCTFAPLLCLCFPSSLLSARMMAG